MFVRSYTSLLRTASSTFAPTNKIFNNTSPQLRSMSTPTVQQAVKLLRIDNISPRVTEAAYAVRGELVSKAADHAKSLETAKKSKVPHSLPFDEIVYCNIGNPQSLGQKPLTYFRQYLSLMEYPEMLESPGIEKIFPKDVIKRVRETMPHVGGGTGSYTHSQGLPIVRKHIAEYIEKRDGFPCDPDNIFVHNGASPAVQDCLRIMIRDEKDGIMIPIPQYPLYSASIALLGGSQVPYYLKEEANWGLEASELERSFKEAASKGINPRSLCIINPGNPTGQVLNESNMREIVDFCHRHKLVLMADEVYQENVYIKEQKPFNSFKKVVKSMGDKYKDFELFSFHSISKGFVGECGHRAGYVELHGVNPEIRAELYKLSSVLLCPNTAGQLLMDVMVKPPAEGEESFPLYKMERDAIYHSLKRRAQKLTKFLDSLPGISCNAAEGAMYAFPQIKLPNKAVEAAKKAGKKPDDFYAIALLDATGVCVVPGSGFGQRDGTYHFRTTFLPSESQIDGVMARLEKFHSNFMNQYKD